jgi:hypothetical protein
MTERGVIVARGTLKRCNVENGYHLYGRGLNRLQITMQEATVPFSLLGRYRPFWGCSGIETFLNFAADLIGLCVIGSRVKFTRVRLLH